MKARSPQTVTRRDVEGAILLGKILGSYDEAFPEGDENHDLGCLADTHCPTCTCTSAESDGCGHCDIWQCVMEARGISSAAELLWLRISNALSDLRPKAGPCDVEDVADRNWAAALVRETRGDLNDLNADLEAAALLEDGLLPPGVVLAKARGVDTWLTRRDVADVLNCSLYTVALLERRGRLRPRHVKRRDARGTSRRVVVYNPRELSRL